jgi:hypothetical protein
MENAYNTLMSDKGQDDCMQSTIQFRKLAIQTYTCNFKKKERVLTEILTLLSWKGGMAVLFYLESITELFKSKFYFLI